MSLQEKKLGRGLSALLGESKGGGQSLKSISIQGANEDNQIIYVPVSKLVAGVYQPRKKFLQEELKEENVIIGRNRL